MSRAVTTGSTDQSIRVWAYDSNGAAITGEAYNSAGIAVSVVVRSAGRILSTTTLTLVARSGAGVHTDSAFTEVGAGEYVVDLPDSYSATANRQVSVTLTSTAISGGYVLSETLDVGVNAELDSTVADQITAIETFATRVTTGIVQDGPVWQFTANMLELGPSGTGGGSSVNVLPATGIVADRSAGTTLTPAIGETISQSITVYQSDGTTAVDLSGKTLKVIFETMSGTDVAVVESANITISGTDDNVVTFAYPSAVTASERTLRFAIRDAAAPLTMYLQGVCSVVAAPKVDV